jgi:hypothetical protein
LTGLPPFKAIIRGWTGHAGEIPSPGYYRPEKEGWKMRAWLAKHWVAVLGALGLLSPGWTGVKWLLDWGGRIDVFRTWGTGLIDALTPVPPWANLLLLLVGLLLIWWDLKGRPIPFSWLAASGAPSLVLSGAPANPASSPPPKVVAKTHPHDIPKKLTVIDEQINPLLKDEGEIELHIRRGRQLLNDWKRGLGPERPQYLEELRDYQHFSASLFDRLLRLQQANPHFEDIAALLDIGNSPYQINETYARGLADFCAAIKAFGDPPYNNINHKFFMDGGRLQLFSSGLANYGGWWQHTKKAFTELRKEIASSWTTPLASSDDTRAHRKELIRGARKFVARFVENHPGDEQAFKTKLESDISFLSLEPHLSKEFLEKLHAPRTIYVQREGTNRPALADWYLDELKRLEKEWGLL